MKEIRFALLILILIAQNLYAEPILKKNEDVKVTLENINFQIEGRTRPERIIAVAGITKEESWKNIEELILWIEEKTQSLINWRELESVKIEYEIRDTADFKLATLTIKIVDSNNIIVLPYPEYSSDTGLDLSLRGRDYNFLGLLSPLEVNIGYMAEQQALEAMDFLDASWYGQVLVSIPFAIKNTEIEYSFEQDFNFSADNVFQSITNNEIDCLFKTKLGNFSTSLTEKIYFNDNNAESFREEYGNYLLGWYFDTNLEASYSKDILEIPRIEQNLNLETSISLNVKNLPDFTFIGKERAGPIFSPSIILSTEKIDWPNNLREGFAASIEATFPYNFYFSKLSPVFNLNSSIYHRFYSWFGLSTNVFATYSPNTIYKSTDEFLRGLSNLDSSCGIFLNIDLPFLLSFKAENLFGLSWTEIFSFDLHLAPFIDMGLSFNEEDPDFTEYQAFYYCPGIEAIIYPEAFRSLFLRISLGFNPEDRDDFYEIYIGLTHQY